MIQQLELRNFRCFEHHIVPLRPVTIVVGKNNAGKSTIVDALRLISLAVTRVGTVNFSDQPEWLDIPRRNRGFRPSIRGMQMNLDTVFYRYGEPPAEVHAAFETGHTVSVYVGPDSDVYAVVLDDRGTPISSKGQAKNAD